MVDPKTSIFHKIYDFDAWIYSEWFIVWQEIAKEDREYFG